MRLRAEVPRHALAGQLVLSKPGLLCQLVPSLDMSYVLREFFRVPGGEGRSIGSWGLAEEIWNFLGSSEENMKNSAEPEEI